MSRVACVTVTYGPTPTLAPMLESLHRTVADRPVEVVVVSQPDSTGRSAADIVGRFPWAHHIALADNNGFARANNLAVAETDCPLVAFLNPDLVLTEGWLRPLADALHDPTVVIAAPPLLTPAGEIDEAGQIMYRDGGSEPWGRAGFDASYDRIMFSRDVDYASAACWLVRRDDFLGLGGFCPEYHPAYFEDVDFAFRARRSGGRSRLVTDRPVIHDHAPPTPDRVDIAVASREVFRRRLAVELESQPDRRSRDDDVERVRDHRCSERRHEHVSRGVGAAEAERRVTAAGEWAAANPTARMTVSCHAFPGVEAWRRRWCPRGLELLVDS